MYMNGGDVFGFVLMVEMLRGGDKTKGGGVPANHHRTTSASHQNTSVIIRHNDMS
jgi:hypothetical protein